MAPMASLDGMKAMTRRATEMKHLFKMWALGVTPGDSAKLKQWKKRCEHIFREHSRDVLNRRPMAPKGHPIEVYILCVYPMVKKPLKTSSRPREWHTKRGDWDNLGKPICDVATGLLWHDDAQVPRGMVEKIIASQGEPPRTEFFARPMLEGPSRTIFEEVVAIAEGALAPASPQGEFTWQTTSPLYERRDQNPSKT